MAQRKDQQLFAFRLDDPTGRALKVKLATNGVKLQALMESLAKGWLEGVIDLAEVRTELMKKEAAETE